MIIHISNTHKLIQLKYLYPFLCVDLLVSRWFVIFLALRLTRRLTLYLTGLMFSFWFGRTLLVLYHWFRVFFVFITLLSVFSLVDHITVEINQVHCWFFLLELSDRFSMTIFHNYSTSNWLIMMNRFYFIKEYILLLVYLVYHVWEIKFYEILDDWLVIILYALILTITWSIIHKGLDYMLDIFSSPILGFRGASDFLT